MGEGRTFADGEMICNQVLDLITCCQLLVALAERKTSSFIGRM